MSDGIHTLAFGHREIIGRQVDIERTAKQIVLAFDDAVGLGVENITVDQYTIQSHPGRDILEATKAISALKSKVYAGRRKRNATDVEGESSTVSSSKRPRLEKDLCNIESG